MSRSGRPAVVCVYRTLLGVLQPSIARQHGAEAEEALHDQYRDMRSTRGRLAAYAMLLRAFWRLLAGTVEPEPRGRPSGSGLYRPAQLVSDVRFSLRSLAARPGYALTAIVILAVGIGATTTIFSVVDTIVLRQLPYPAAGRLVHFANGNHSFPSFRAWREMSSFASVVASRDLQMDLTGQGAPERLQVVAVSDGFFRMFGAAPHLGRLFDADDYPGAGTIGVLGYGAWQRLLNGDDGIVGRPITLNGAPVTIVGVLSADFRPPAVETGDRVDVWLPLDNGGDRIDSHGSAVLGIIGRLGPGSSLQIAQAEIDAQRAAAAAELPEYYQRPDGSVRTIPLRPLREATIRGVSRTLYLLFGAVGLLLLIACANVANLLLARGTTRAREIGLRKALGASRSRLVALVLTEAVVLALIGGLAGMVMTYVAVEAFRAINPGGVPRIDELAVDARVLAGALALTILTGVFFGGLPAWQASRVNLVDVAGSSRTATTGRAGRRIRNALIVSEIALALVLCAGAGLLGRSLAALTSVDPGFQVSDLTVLTVAIDTHPEADRPRFVAELTDGIRSLPGTTHVAASWTLPFTYTGRSRCCWARRVTGDQPSDSQSSATILHPVTETYFATLGATLRSGREFGPDDMHNAAPVAVLNRPAAMQLFGRDNVLGLPIRIGDRALTVVGVVDGVHHWGLNQDVEPAVYLPFGEFGGGEPDVNIAVRSAMPPAALADALRGVVRQADPLLPSGTVTTMDAMVAQSVATPRFLALLFGAFAGVALLLAAGGVYGSMLYTVGQRRREMGIRLALGADAGSVIRLVLRYGLAVTGIGIAAGLAGAVASARLMTTLVWGVSTTDRVTLAAVAIVLGVTGLCACTIPAFRASRTDPLDTLRAE